MNLDGYREVETNLSLNDWKMLDDLGKSMASALELANKTPEMQLFISIKNNYETLAKSLGVPPNLIDFTGKINMMIDERPETLMRYGIRPDIRTSNIPEPEPKTPEELRREVGSKLEEDNATDTVTETDG